MNCEICGKKVEINFLSKIFGTYLRKDGKKIAVCSDCQGRFATREEMLANIK